VLLDFSSTGPTSGLIGRRRLLSDLTKTKFLNLRKYALKQLSVTVRPWCLLGATSLNESDVINGTKLTVGGGGG
jgi:hypothetical protein